MKRVVVLMITLASVVCVAQAGKKEEQAAAAQKAQEQKQSAYMQDQIARKKAILNFQMVVVEGGSFNMGCTEEQKDECLEPEKPAHPVFVRTFTICKYCVTQRQWREVMGKNPSDVRNEDAPVTNVSWNDVQKFLAKLNNFTGRNYRLPTEAEWEFAARGGNNTNDYKYSGGNDMYQLGWYKDNGEGEPHVGGKRKDNELGIFDMSGNLWEWCSDWYGPYPSDTETELIDPTGATEGTERVVRGGYYEGPTLFCRVSCRNKSKPDYAASIIGLRLAEDRDANE